MPSDLSKYLGYKDTKNDATTHLPKAEPKKAAKKIFQNDITIDHLPIDKIVKDRLKKDFTYLYPNQVEAASSFFSIPILKSAYTSYTIGASDVPPDRVVLNEKVNYVITTDTSSGKTVIGHMYMQKHLQKHKKGLAIYIVPLKALGSEKYREFKKLYDGIYSVNLVMGNERKITKDPNILITTYEKFDQLLNTSKEEILKRACCLVVDELHWIATPDRGKSLDMCIAKALSANIPILGLSATIQNSADIAKWLDGGLIRSKFRPVPLKKGICTDDTLYWINDKGDIDCKEDLLGGLDEYIYEKYQQNESILYFRQSKPNVRAYAKKIADMARKRKLEKSDDLELPDVESSFDETLNDCIKYRCAFHNASMSSTNREYIEKMFIDRRINFLSATPTLAAGVNTPARWGFIDPKGFREGSFGYLPISEIKQMYGRVGRPQFDDEGYAIINIGNDDTDIDSIIGMYFSSESDNIYSPIDKQDIGTFALGLISGDHAHTIPALRGIFEKTLAAHQSPKFKSSLDNRIITSISDLLTSNPKMLFSKDGKTFNSTEFGTIITGLYINPLLGLLMYDFITNKPKDMHTHFNILYFLFANTNLPTLSAKTDDNLWMSLVIDDFEEDLEIMSPSKEINYQALKTAGILVSYSPQVWAKTECNERDFFDYHKISRGDIQAIVGKMSNFDWIMTALKRIAYYAKNKDFIVTLDRLEMRLHYGISDELVDICKVNYVGKQIGKALYAHGITMPDDLAKADPIIVSQFKTDASVVGIKIAEKIIANAKELCK